MMVVISRDASPRKDSFLILNYHLPPSTILTYGLVLEQVGLFGNLNIQAVA